MQCLWHNIDLRRRGARIIAVDTVTGPYDVIARGEAADLDELAKAIVMPIQAVEGVTRTLTCPVLQL